MRPKTADASFLSQNSSETKNKIPDFVTPPSSYSQTSINDKDMKKSVPDQEIKTEIEKPENITEPEPIRKQVTFDLGELGRQNIIRKRYKII